MANWISPIEDCINGAMLLFFRILELLFKSAFAANEAIETLKSIREDVTVRLMELGENTSELIRVCK